MALNFPRLLGGGEVPATEPGEVVKFPKKSLPSLMDSIEQRQRIIAEIDATKTAYQAEMVKLDNEREQEVRKLKADQERWLMITRPLMTETGE